jgi:hypothetical protein
MATWQRFSIMALLLLLVWSWAASSSLAAQVENDKGQPRFSKAPDGVITDSATGLDWYVGQESTWHQAKAWVESLSVAGGGWRLPTVAELKAIYQKGASANNMDPLFHTTVVWAWSGELRNAWSVWGLAFYNNLEGWHSMNYGNGRLALAVRSHR